MKFLDLITDWETLVSLWEKKRACIATIIFTTTIWFIIAKAFVPSFDFFSKWNLLIFPIWIIITITWFLTTNRIPLGWFNNKLIICIAVNIDEQYENRIKSILKSAVRELTKEPSLKNLKICLLPINLFYNYAEIEPWQAIHSSVDNVIFLRVNAGNQNSEEKFKVVDISHSCYSPHLMEELRLRNVNKDWVYLHKNSLDDKIKLKNNLQDIVLYYAGLRLLALDRTHESLLILKSLYNPEVPEAKGKKDVSKKLIKPKSIQASRFSNILATTYVSYAIKCFFKDDKNKATQLLHEAENILCHATIRKEIFTGLAFIYFNSGDLDQSKGYTVKMKEVGGTTFNYLVNMGFYAIIENDHNNFHKYYSKITPNMANSNAVEIISFLDDQQARYPTSNFLFRTAEAILTKLYIDDDRGNEHLDKIISETVGVKKYLKIYIYLTTLKGRKISISSPLQLDNSSPEN